MWSDLDWYHICTEFHENLSVGSEANRNKQMDDDKTICQFFFVQGKVK
jgi:hypothetical protein